MSRKIVSEKVEMICPLCSGSAREIMQEERFPVGEGGVEARAIVPLMVCDNGDFSWTDERAELIRYDAACVALGLLTPDEIRNIRARYGMNRREFAAAFKIGHASLERWENRKLLIGAQSDYYLRLLQDVSAGRRLLLSAAQRQSAAMNLSNVIEVNFRALSSQRVRLEAAMDRKDRFHLKTAVR